MFTGIVENRVAVVAAEGRDGARRLTVEWDDAEGLQVGSSIALNGVCLTAVEIYGHRVAVDVIDETLNRSNLGELSVGDEVNVERPMPAGGRFDGHIVQGHVDGVGEVAGITLEGDGRRLKVEAPEEILRYVAEKGSVTLDGISLTVTTVRGGEFEVAVIPHTLAVTTLGLREVGDKVNLEVDVLAKYVERLLKAGL